VNRRGAGAAAALLGLAGLGWPRDLVVAGGAPTLALKSSLEADVQATAAGAGQPADAISFWRLRVEPTWKPGGDVTASAAWEGRTVLATAASASQVLPSQAPAFFRIRPLGSGAGSGRWSGWQGLDRAWVAYQPGWGAVTVGRQAIGFGRGEFFGAVDILAPFSPLELDREWRRGVDAAQADVRIGDRLSVNAVAAAGSNPLAAGAPVTRDDSAFAGRVRGDLGWLDAEVIAGRRGRDGLAGVSASLPLGGPEIHGEGAVFLTRGDVPDSGLLGARNAVPKAVVGGSNHFAWGQGVDVALEYHYSGFGLKDVSTLPSWLATPGYAARILRGDTQIPGRQAGSLNVSWPFTPLTTLSLHWVQSLVDRSGALAPALTWNFAESVTLAASGVVGFGAGPSGGVPRTQFGGLNPAGIVQVKIYD